MKQFKLWMLAAILALCGSMTFTSCTNEDNSADIDDPVVLKARVLSSIHIDEALSTVYTIEYPSTDPFGKPIMLSGTITVSDMVTANTRAKGLLLYNHYTIHRADQCPSAGNLKVELITAGSGLITISPDYYGFGITGDKLQAYCISQTNAQASVDALLAAKELLPTLGYSWNDNILFNIGYSQGGQTAMGVVRLIDEKYPNLHVTYTFAGGGSYDIPATYSQFIQSGITGMPSTVVSVLLAYNEYYGLNIPREEIFKEPLLSNIDEWMLSKKYTSEEIDTKIGSLALSDFLTPAMLDIKSPISTRFIEAMEQDNLSKGWTPRTYDNIVLVHHIKDITVPVINAMKLYEFLKYSGVENITPYVSDFGSIAEQPAHETGAIVFASTAMTYICKILGIDAWFNVADLF